MRKKTSATITFHASHNYGSALQAYALQQTVLSLGIKNQIINLRTERQKEVYSVFTKRKGVRYLFKNLAHLAYYSSLKEKHTKFESFIKSHLITTEQEFLDSDDIKKNAPPFDYYIAGSDQIWNPIPEDFDWAYYLDFVKEGKKTSYAPSFGPLSLKGNTEINQKIKDLLCDFDSLSVREKRASEAVWELCKIKAPVVCDPTLLLTKEEWTRLSSEEMQVEGKYIFLYTLFANKEIIKIAKILSKKTGLPVVVSNFSNQYDIVNSFVKKYQTGPQDFLHLIKNAEFVLTSSFHGTVFSLIFQKPFFAIGGLEDSRISTLIENTKLEDRAVTLENIEGKLEILFELDFSEAELALQGLRTQGIEYLKAALELEKNENL